MSFQEPVQTCKKCNLSINEGHAYELGDDRWHINCFKCSKCESSLGCNSNFLVLGNGSLICSNCSYNCKQCGKKIDDLAILTGDQAYCSSCFKCRSCKLKIEDLRYARTSKGLFCMSCHEKLIAKKKKVDMKKKQLALLEQQRDQEEKLNLNHNHINLNNLDNGSRHLQDISNHSTPKMSDPASKRNSGLFLQSNRSSSSMVTKTLPPPPAEKLGPNGQPAADNDFSIEEINDSDDELNKRAQKNPVHQIELKIHEDEAPLAPGDGLIIDIIESLSDPSTPKDDATPLLEPPANITPNQNQGPDKLRNKNLLILSPNQFHDNEFHTTGSSPVTSPNKSRSTCASPYAKANRQARVMETYDDAAAQQPDRAPEQVVPNFSTHSPPPRAAVPSTPVKTPTSSAGTPSSTFEPRGLGLEGIDYHNKRSSHLFTATPAITSLEDTIRDDDIDPAPYVHPSPPAPPQQAPHPPASPAAPPQASPALKPSAKELAPTISRKNTLIRTPKLSLKHKRSTSGGSGSGLSSKFGFFKSRDDANTTNSGSQNQTSVTSPSKDSYSTRRHSRHVSDGSISNGGSAFTTPPLPYSSPIGQYGFNREHVRSTSDTPFITTGDSDLNQSNSSTAVHHQQSELYKHELDLRQIKNDIYHFEVQRQTLHNDVKRLNNDKLKLNDHLKQVQSKLTSESSKYDDLVKEVANLEAKKKKLLEINQSLSEENHQLETSIKNKSSLTPSNSIHRKHSPQDHSDNKTSSTGGTNYTNLTSNSSSSLLGNSYSEVGINSNYPAEESGETHKATRLKFWRRPKISLSSVNGNGESPSTNDYSGTNLQVTTSNNNVNGNGVTNGNGNSNNGSTGLPYNGHYSQNGVGMTNSESFSNENGNKKGLGSFITKSRSTNILDSFINGGNGVNGNGATNPDGSIGHQAPLFSSTIQKRADYEKEKVPLIITKCIEEVERRGLDLEGIYRLSGGNSAIQSIENAFNSLVVTNDGVDEKTLSKLNEISSVDINAVTSALKRYLRKIPDPLIPFSLYDEYIKVSSQNAPNKVDKRVSELKTKVIYRLSPANKATLFILCKHLALVNSYQSINRMGYKNLSVVFAPTVARDATGEKEMNDMGYRNDVTEFLLNNYEKIFEGYI